MRVLHISSRHKPFDVRIFHKECRSLAGSGVDTHLLVVDPPTAEAGGVHLHPLHLPRPWGFPYHWVWAAASIPLNRLVCKPLNHARQVVRIAEQARAIGADIYHFHDPELIPVGLMLKQEGGTVVYDVHEDAPVQAYNIYKNYPIRAFMRSNLLHFEEVLAKRCLDAFVCATPLIAGKFPKDRTITVFNYPLLEEFHAITRSAPPARLQDRPPHVAYAGGITRLRGIKEMVQAIELVPARLQSKLQLIGRFSPADLQKELEQLPGWQRTEFWGYQSHGFVFQTLARCRVGLVVLHPEKNYLDAYPTKLYEYMAAGVPVIASDFPLYRRIVEENGCGLVVNPLDAQAIAAAIVHLLENPAQAQEMGRRGRDAILHRFNWEIEAQKLLDLYRRLEPQRGAPRLRVAA